MPATAKAPKRAKLKRPKVKAPKVKAPKMKAPTIKLPKLKAPRKIQPPQLKVGRKAKQGDPEVEAEARELLVAHERLLERFTIMQTDLGGAFYEMAIRDHVKLDVLTRKAAELQRVDVELQEIEAKLSETLVEQGTECPSCGEEVAPSAAFCAACGHQLGKGASK